MLGLVPVTAQGRVLGQEQQCLGPDLGQAEPLADGEAVAGVPGGLIEFEQRVAGGGELEVEHRGRAQRAELGRGPSGLGEPPGTRVAEQLNRAQFVQRPQPPDRQPGRVGDGEGTLESVLRRCRDPASARCGRRSPGRGSVPRVRARRSPAQRGPADAPAPGRRLPARPRLPAPPPGRSAPGPGWKPAARGHCQVLAVAGQRVASAAAWASRRCTRARATALAFPAPSPASRPLPAAIASSTRPASASASTSAPSARARCSPGRAWRRPAAACPLRWPALPGPAPRRLRRSAGSRPGRCPRPGPRGRRRHRATDRPGPGGPPRPRPARRRPGRRGGAAAAFRPQLPG